MLRTAPNKLYGTILLASYDKCDDDTCSLSTNSMFHVVVKLNLFTFYIRFSTDMKLIYTQTQFTACLLCHHSHLIRAIVNLRAHEIRHLTHHTQPTLLTVILSKKFPLEMMQFSSVTFAAMHGEWLEIARAWGCALYMHFMAFHPDRTRPGTTMMLHSSALRKHLHNKI